MSLKILILGVNGFIGSSLTEFVLKNRDWSIFGMDIGDDKLTECLDHPRFKFVEGDITINKEWIEYHIKKCDIVLPLVAIANPSVYVKDPLRVFELDFEANLPIVRKCAAYGKRLIFPSTSEVYGMSEDSTFDEEETNLVLGPIHKQRWIYACAKQMIDRVIYAYGFRDNLDYTLFRPFNWIGPKLDDVFATKEGSSRAVAQFIGNIFAGRDLQLVGGGKQRRSFTYIDDGIDALIRIIENKDNLATQRIFNIGNPQNDVSIVDLAHLLIQTVRAHPLCPLGAKTVNIIPIDAEAYFGKHYQDASARIPSIKNGQRYLGWSPQVDLKTALARTVDYHLTRWMGKEDGEEVRP